MNKHLFAASAAVIAVSMAFTTGAAAQTKSIKAQSSWPASLTFAANYYWPQEGAAPAARKDARKK